LINISQWSCASADLKNSAHQYPRGGFIRLIL
jgi:hypothetical protein